MALTVDSYRPDVGRVVLSTPGDASYSTGGFAADPEKVAPMRTPKKVFVHTSSPLYTGKYDAANKKIKAYNIADGSEVTGATDLSGVTFSLDCVL